MSNLLVKIMFISLGLFISGCGDDKKTEKIKNKYEDTSLTDALDLQMLNQTNEAMKKLDKNDIWSGYSLSKQRIYMIKVDNGKPVGGYLINPSHYVNGAEQLGDNEDQGLNVFRYDINVKEAYKSLSANNGNGIYSFDYKVSGEGYYIQTYDMASVDINSGPADGSIRLLSHELFHSYQGKKFTQSSDYVQEMNGYPIQKNLIALSLLMRDVMKDLPTKLTKQDALSRLEKYVTIKSEEIRLDSSNGLLVKNMGLWQEQVEGSAYYVDTMLGKGIFPYAVGVTFFGSDGYNLDLTFGLNAQETFGWSYFYPSGASAIFLLEQAGFDIKKIEKGLSPYAAAKSIVSIDENDEVRLLAQMKIDYPWDLIEVIAEDYYKQYLSQ
ncbi:MULTISPECIES: hypothetical protein [unclassified Aliivibrio]|uniref:hypothetical protein n=1 Tax=unclassified Aliivibrio TaxID=2645654 RepID=UPI00080EA44D|nr:MULTISPECIES: hypothetical protein [unclassified Aliivibrio]OCH15312.1 hypothetical protein A6E05_18765 [Aliivibrio sp. 1S165]OCH23618.1 hypothetical protein A6E03_08190 [Aliivibrio sp. 1S128]OCH34317.1 hypothetical protein A6E06_00345 [Aliivibrio sp. 1S175]